MKYYDMPAPGDKIKVKIHQRIGGGYYIGRVLHTATLMDGRSFAMVRLERKFQNGIIGPVDLDRKTIQVALHATEVWEFANGK